MIWAAAQLGSSLYSPLIFSSYTAVWYAKISHNLQGRVFAADYVVGLVIESSASLAAGLLVDQIFEPAMQSGGRLTVLLGPMIGTGTGSGIALLYIASAIGMIFIGIGGFTIPQLRDAEALIPDHDSI